MRILCGKIKQVQWFEAQVKLMKYIEFKQMRAKIILNAENNASADCEIFQGHFISLKPNNQLHLRLNANST